MRSALGFFSVVAFGFLVVGVLVVSLSGGGVKTGWQGALSMEQIDLGSAIVGIVIGCILSLLARVSWSELPRRMIDWLVAHETSFYRLVLGALFLGILFYY